MRGRVDIELNTPQIVYRMSLTRNITLVRGDSGSGKSYLCDLLRQAAANVEDVMLTLSQKVDFLVMPEVTTDPRISRSWDEIIKSCNDTIIFIDETCDCLKSGVFSQVIQDTTNYYVLFSRGTHADIPYSVDSILYFDKELSDIGPRVTSRQLRPESLATQQLAPSLIVTEDEKAGFVIYKHMYSIPVVSAKSKTKIVKKLKSLAMQDKDGILLVVDGAAFGAEIEKVSDLLQGLFKNSYVFMPESFEWILLHSPVFVEVPDIEIILYKYLEIIDWSRYFSAERFFTSIIKELTKKLGLEAYDKSVTSLDSIFLQESSLEEFRKLLPIKYYSEKTNFFS